MELFLRIQQGTSNQEILRLLWKLQVYYLRKKGPLHMDF
jgi:hypothetical protein